MAGRAVGQMRCVAPRPQRNPLGGVAVYPGAAKDVAGAGGGVVVVVAGSASLISGPDPVPACSLAMATPTAPTATSALAPMAADNSLTLFCVFEFTLTTPFGSGPSTMRRGVALMVQVHRGYPARPAKTPEMPDWQPMYRFSRQRYAGSPGIRERRARGRCGNRGYSQPVRVGPGGCFGGRRLY